MVYPGFYFQAPSPNMGLVSLLPNFNGCMFFSSPLSINALTMKKFKKAKKKAGSFSFALMKTFWLHILSL